MIITQGDKICIISTENVYYSLTHKKYGILFSSQTHKQTKNLHGILVCKLYSQVCFTMDPVFFRNRNTTNMCENLYTSRP